MEFKVGDKVKVLNTEFGNKGKIGTIENISGTTMIYFVKLDGSCNSQWSNASDLELVTEEETSMKFKVGDKVRITWSCLTNKDKEGVISEDDGSAIPYKVTLDGGEVEWKHGNHITKLEEKVMKFKVGDRVQVVATYSGFRGDKGNVTENDGTDNLPIKVRFDDGDHVCWFYEDDLKVLYEEEKVMKFKVGDKVKVSNSWFGFTDEVGVIASVQDQEPEFKYTVKFNVEDGENKEESFREVELKLVSEKQSFIKSDLKTGMGVVLRNGDMGHLLLGTPFGDTLRFLNKGSWEDFGRYGDDLTHESSDFHDIVEVYSTEWSYMYLTDRVFEQECVFKREEPKPEPTKMTMKEINEHFGKAIEIVE